MQKAQLHAIFLPELFARIWKKWGPLTLDDLTVFFAASTQVDEELA
jgi:hypothetical protein